MLFAVDAAGWSTIIGAGFLGVAQITAMILSYKREQALILRETLRAKEAEAKEQAQIRREQVVAGKVEEVKTAATQVANKVEEVAKKADQHTDKIEVLTVAVNDVHQATNGMMQAIKDAEYAKGVKSEKDKENKTPGGN